jgi:hypothetical protein
MLGRHKSLILVAAIVLIPILLWVTPVNMVHKLSNGCPFSHSKQIQRSDSCLSNSAISHDDPTIVNLNVTSLEEESTRTSDIEVLDLDFIHFDITFNSVPLRC